MVFYHLVEGLKHCAKKSRFSQIRQRINLILLAKSKLPRHLIAKTCGCSQMLGRSPPFPWIYLEKKAPVDHLGVVFR
ncbi:hypothetical protein NEOC65_002323 [Neochlamydia sp. AcF65]|nr:hypothetical protein [Neochlamydia sp. AcF65]